MRYMRAVAGFLPALEAWSRAIAFQRLQSCRDPSPMVCRRIDGGLQLRLGIEKGFFRDEGD